MSMESFAQALQRMATVDLESEGDWSADSANERCMEYARLVNRLFGTVDA